jgi:plastocyanin
MAAGCGKSETTPSGMAAPPTATATIVISNNVASPRTIVVARGTQVTFTNSDATSHNMNSDPHPEHTDCPEINQAGFLTAGQSRQTGNLNVARTCGFHDHGMPEVAALHGTITVQ